jgi:lipopolysaccharide export system permease protein
MSLGFYVIYWALLIGGEKLADRGHIDPFISMWAGNFIIGLLGLYLTLRVSRETWKLFTFKRKRKP